MSTEHVEKAPGPEQSHVEAAPETAPAQPAPRAKRLYEIDLLRILAALAVVFFHYAFSGWMQGLTPFEFPTFSAVARYGYLGVDLFFTISGFVVLLSAWGRRPHQFVISRVVRLYPAFWFAVSLTALISVLSGKFPVGIGQYLANMTMVNAVADIPNIDVVYWTLWAELRFYAVIFLLTLIGLTVRRVLNALWIWLALTGLVEIGLVPEVADLVLQTTFSHYFIAGMALSLIYRFGPTKELAAILILSYANAIYRGIGYAEGVEDRYGVAFHPWVIVVAIWVIFGVMTLVSMRATESLGRPWFSVAGSLTYPLYLVHAYIGFVVLDWVGDVVPDNLVTRWAVMLGLVAVMCAVAYGIHIAVERPLSGRLKRALNGLAGAASGRRDRRADPPGAGNDTWMSSQRGGSSGPPA